MRLPSDPVLRPCPGRLGGNVLPAVPPPLEAPLRFLSVAVKSWATLTRTDNAEPTGRAQAVRAGKPPSTHLQGRRQPHVSRIFGQARARTKLRPPGPKSPIAPFRIPRSLLYGPVRWGMPRGHVWRSARPGPDISGQGTKGRRVVGGLRHCGCGGGAAGPPRAPGPALSPGPARRSSLGGAPRRLRHPPPACDRMPSAAAVPALTCGARPTITGFSPLHRANRRSVQHWFDLLSPAGLFDSV